ncbi:hypothetical protein BH20ACI4_BH20ACI4_20310 [soil metagenome]
MKKIIMILMIAIGVSSVAFGQMKMSKNTNKSVEAQITALEKAGWEAWKNKDAAWFQNNTSDDALSVHADGVSNKTQIIKGISDCEVKSVSLDDFKFMMLDKNSALITFTGNQDAVCGGAIQPAVVRASSVYVKRNGKWLNTFYTEVAADQESGSVETQIIGLEKAGWAAWKNKDTSWFQKNTTDDYLLVNNFGVENKSQLLESTANGCEVKSYSLDNFKFVMMTKDSALLTYTAMQDAVCEGNTLPKNVNSSAVYVRRGGKWLGSLYMETAAAK